MNISPARQISLNNKLSGNQLNTYLQSLDQRISKLEESMNGTKPKDTVRRSRTTKGSGKDVPSA